MPLTDAPIRILVVDDEESIRNALKRFLSQQGYETTTAASGDEALGLVRRQQFSVLVLDVRMPGRSGIDLVPQILEADPALAILMLTAVNEATAAALCLQRGAMDYLTKPVDLADLARAILRAIRRRDSLLEQARASQRLKEEVEVRTAELSQERDKLERLSVATLEALVNALEAKDPFIRGHSTRVADLGAKVAAEMGLSDELIEQVRMAGRLHDIGQIGVREEILGKEGPLTTEEYEQVKQHVVIGSQILAPLAHLGEVITFVRGHHERWDGKGYPDHVQSGAMPIGARILAAVEIFDALTTARPYQEKMPPDLALERMHALSGTVVDPEVVQALAAAVRRHRLASAAGGAAS